MQSTRTDVREMCVNHRRIDVTLKIVLLLLLSRTIKQKETNYFNTPSFCSPLLLPSVHAAN